MPETETMPAVKQEEVPPEKKKRARKAKKDGTGKPPRAPRTTPKNTLAAWLKNRGPNHQEAARILGAQFKDDLRYALTVEADRAKDAARLEKAKAAVVAAQEVVDANRDYNPSALFADLDALAASITAAKGGRCEKPSQDTDDATATADVDAAD